MKIATMNHSYEPGTAVYALIATGLGGIGAKLADHGLDVASVSAFLGSAAAFLMAASHFVTALRSAIVESIAKWKEAQPIVILPVPGPAPAPIAPPAVPPGAES